MCMLCCVKTGEVLAGWSFCDKSSNQSTHTYIKAPHSQSEEILQQFKKLSKSELSQSEVILQELKKLSFSLQAIAYINQHMLQNMQ